jgi:hypothetical protein
MVGMHAQSRIDWKIKKQKNSVYKLAKISLQINNIRDTGRDTENMDHGPDMGFTDYLSTNQNREF